MSNTIGLVREVVGDLQAAGFDVAVFGGWAEELQGITPAREHDDIDLVVFDAGIACLDTFIKTRAEIEAKRFSHKRAYIAREVMIEILLINGGVSLFWDRLAYRWPDAARVEVKGLPVAPREYLSAYTRDYTTIRAAWTNAPLA